MTTKWKMLSLVFAAAMVAGACERREKAPTGEGAQPKETRPPTEGVGEERQPVGGAERPSAEPTHEPGMEPPTKPEPGAQPPGAQPGMPPSAQPGMPPGAGAETQLMAVDMQGQSFAVTDPEIVRDLERKLSEQGFSLTADGKFDSQTRQALTQFQMRRGLEPTGKLDRNTAKALGIDWDKIERARTGAGTTGPAGEAGPGGAER